MLDLNMMSKKIKSMFTPGSVPHKRHGGPEPVQTIKVPSSHVKQCCVGVKGKKATGASTDVRE